MAKKEKEIFGKTEPRIFTPPLRPLTPQTSLGFAAIEYAKTVLGKTLYPWQSWVLTHMLEIIGDLEHDWHFRFNTVLILVARQNGKTVLSEVLASFFLNVLKVPRVLGTSLSVDKALETLKETVKDQETIPILAREIYKISHANGYNRMELTGDRIYKIAATNDACGRGDTNSLILLDELREHRNWVACDAAFSSTNAVPNAMIVCFSNAGSPASVVLRQIRSQAIAELEKNNDKKKNFGGEDMKNLGIFEWSAKDEAETDDIEQLAQANPALGYGKVTKRMLLSRRSTMPENSFRSECMCQTVTTLLEQPFPKDSWEKLLDSTSTIDDTSEIYYGIDMSLDRTAVSIAACGKRPDGAWHIELITKRNGTQWALDWFRERSFKGQVMKVAFQGRGAPICGLAEEICTLNNVERLAIEGPALSESWARFYDGIAAANGETDATKIYHLDQPLLNHCAKIMQLKQMGNGVSLPDRAKSPDDISALFACIIAFGAATQIKPKEEKKVYESVYNQENYDFKNMFI